MIGSQIFTGYFDESKLTQIAQGGFSQIFLTECGLTKKQVVIKKMKNENKQILNTLSQEATCIQKLNQSNQPNIIRIYNHLRLDNCIYIAMEYCPLGSLERFLEEHKQLTYSEILIFARQMIIALMIAHKLGLAHSDIKPENILLRSREEYVLTDWGSAQQLNHQHSTLLRDNTSFTLGYQAPELMSENLFSSNMKFNYFLADIYSLGMTLLRCTGPSFREIRTISSEDDKLDHDRKVQKMFASYILNHEYQDGVISSIISGFLNYEKTLRMRLEEALSLLDFQQKQNQIEENLSLSQLKISTPTKTLGKEEQNNTSIRKNRLQEYQSQMNNDVGNNQDSWSSNTINGKIESLSFSESDQSQQSSSISNSEEKFQFKKPHSKTYQQIDKQISQLYQEKQEHERSDSSRKRYREMKKSKNGDNQQQRLNKNLSISDFSELDKVNNNIDYFKAFLQNQVTDSNVGKLGEKIGIMKQAKKIFLNIGGNSQLTDVGLLQLAHYLSTLNSINEFMLDISNLGAVVQLLQMMKLNNLEEFSLTVNKLKIEDEQFDEFVVVVGNLQSLKKLSLSFCQCNISEDDAIYLCENVQDKEGIQKFLLYCPKGSIRQEEASKQEKILELMMEVKIQVC